MNEIIQNLEVNATNGKENFCYISEKQLKAMKELSKREAKENKQLEQQVKKQKEAIDKLKRYIDGCLELSPIEDRSVTDDVLDKELKYFLKILKEVLE